MPRSSKKATAQSIKKQMALGPSLAPPTASLPRPAARRVKKPIK